MTDTDAVAAGIAQAITTISKELTESTLQYAKGQIKKVLLDLEIGFQTYLTRNYERCSKVKTLLHRVYPVDIHQAYVGGRVQVGPDTVITHSDLIKSLDKYPRLIITGIAGSGKSMFQKYLCVSLYKEPFPKIPVFVELRHLNKYEKNSLSSFIVEQFSSLTSYFGDAEIEHCLKTGKFVLILDGLDEVGHSIRDNVCKQILEFSYKYSRSSIIISSRPDERFLSWNEFLTGKILPLEKEEVIELVKKIGHHDQSLVQNFIKQIDDRLYKTHFEFVSNPLLCTMMLLTFDQFAEIPSKMHIFYAQAFDALFNKHDATKSLFHREFYTKLSIDEFRRLFSTFCLFSFLDRSTSFTAAGARAYLKEAIEYENLTVSAENVLSDLQESLCLLVLDGDLYSFLHRSFQEYFVAQFLAEREIDRFQDLVDQVYTGGESEVMELFIDISKENFEEKYFLRKVQDLKKAFSRVRVKKQSKVALKMFFSGLAINENGRVIGHFIETVNHMSEWHPIFSLLQSYYNTEGYFTWPKAYREYDWERALPHAEDGDRIRKLSASAFSESEFGKTPAVEYFSRIKKGVSVAEAEIRKRKSKRGKFIRSVLARRNSRTLGF